MKKTYLSSSERETRQIGSDIASEISGKSREKAVLICLSGDLGAGKTAFVKGFLSGFGVKSRVTSPTFVVMKRYSVRSGGFKNIYHLDLYRVRDPDELDVLGLNELLKDPENIILVEWPENGGRLRPAFRVEIFHLPEEHARKISITRV